MGAKKIIIPIAIAAVVACGVGYYSYNTVKASTLSESTTSSSSTLASSTTLSSSTNTNVNSSSTKATTTNNNEVSTATALNANGASNSNDSSTIKTGNTTISNNNKTTSNEGSNTGNTSSNSTNDTQSTSGEKSSTESSTSSGTRATGTTNNTNGTTSNIGSSSSSTSSQTLNNLHEKYIEQLNEVGRSAFNIAYSTAQENPSQYEIDNEEEEICNLWENEFNCIYEQLQQSLPASEFSTLQQEQNSWISSINEDAKNYAQSYTGGGSDYTAILYMKLGEYYKGRCYYLVDTYM